ncbi:UNVERIFIED_CONTAM: hypothetical protein Sangu_2238100 [Sesamum angustifolium]|uniref:Integrase zinc-binding domain-containing protein n=1 Tax=Sesamum angustifolium TaxID=2727405 RepID=A0AAW2L3R6_9LAMI
MHDSALEGHSRINGTLQRLRMLFYWPAVKDEVYTWVKESEICQRAKNENTAYPGLSQPLPIHEQAWLTKYFHFISIKHPYTIVSIAKVFFDNIYKLHGLPVSIMTDRDKDLQASSGRSGG